MSSEIKEGLKIISLIVAVLMCAVIIFGGIFIILANAEDRLEEETPQPYQTTIVEGDLHTTCEYNAYDRLLFKTVYNTETKVTINYAYIYETNGWGTNLVKVQVITTDENGNIISQTK